MKALRNYVDKIKPNFEKGGKFEKLYSTFDAFETFLFVPNKVTTTGSHIRDSIDMKRTMSLVVFAMVPTLLFGIWNSGYQYFLSQGIEAGFWQMVGFGALKVLPIVAVSYISGLTIEFIFAQIRGHEVNEGFLVSGMLIPLTLPVNIPLWMVALATAFAVIIGKEVFGGSGMNILNPALTARAFLFFAYPSDMSGDLVWVANLAGGENIVSGYTGATILGQAAAGSSTFSNGLAEFTPINMFLGIIPGSIGETSVLAILIGAAILLFTGIGSWRIMLSVFVGGWVMGLILNAFAGASGLSPEQANFFSVPAWQHLIIGGFAFGAVYMATDPVSGSQTNKGKYIYGFLIGFLAILIRVLNPAYPEGVMLAILLMNVFAPLIDHYVVEGNIKRRMKRLKLVAQQQ